MMKEEKAEIKINSILFSANQKFFVMSTTIGFKIYESSDCILIYSKKFNASISIADFLDNANIVAFVGSTNNSIYPPNKVLFWNNLKESQFNEIEFVKEVRMIRLKPNFITAAIDSRVYVYGYPSSHLKYVIDTSPNPTGIMSTSVINFVLACPSKTIGTSIIYNAENNAISEIKCSSKALAYLELNYNGKFLVSTSINGTEIRIFDCDDKKQIKEFKRGSSEARITSILFHPLNHLLACCSNRQAVHIFAVKELLFIKNNSSQSEDIKVNTDQVNDKSALNFLGSLISGFFDSEYSFSRIKIKADFKICGFIGDDKIIVITKDCKAYVAELPQKSGPANIVKIYDI